MASNQIPLESFMHALHWLGIDDIDEDELECILANLIAEVCLPNYFRGLFTLIGEIFVVIKRPSTSLLPTWEGKLLGWVKLGV